MSRRIGLPVHRHDGMRTALRRVVLIVMLLAVIPVIVRAAVRLISFEAIALPPVVRLTWETASEVNMAGFYIQRASPDAPAYQRISGIVPAVGDIIGASYVYTDSGVASGRTYYYRLEAVELGRVGEVYGPITVTLPSPTTATPTPTPTGEQPQQPPSRLPTMTPTPATTAMTTATATPTPVPPTATRASPTSAAPAPTAGPTFPSSVIPSPTIGPAPAPTSAGAPSYPEATLAPAPTATPAETPAAVSPVAGASPSPSPSDPPASTAASSPGQLTGRQESSLSCLWPLALLLAGCGLLLLGGWWFWWARRGR